MHRREKLYRRREPPPEKRTSAREVIIRFKEIRRKEIFSHRDPLPQGELPKDLHREGQINYGEWIRSGGNLVRSMPPVHFKCVVRSFTPSVWPFSRRMK